MARIDSIEVTDELKQKAYLKKLLEWLPRERTENGRVSYLDETFRCWLERTGELPPDFDIMPSIPFLPDPLVMDEGRRNIPVKNTDQWNEQRKWMQMNLEYYITGTSPPPPSNLSSKIIYEKQDGEVTVQMVELSFGPGNRAKLNVELMIPPGAGPFPVFLTQWNHREWAQIAVRRGYIGCVYAGADAKDDTEYYSEIWAGEYDFTRLMRRAWGASRVVDYLITRAFVDADKIGITGHSRNGKLSLMAAAFDDRIAACIPSSGNTGAEIPWRYTSINFDIEDIALLTSARPSWFHPRLRFFAGQEHKLPVDQNHLMALIAPRGLMLSAALNEGAANTWAAEQAYFSAQRVYDFLDAGNKLSIRSRHGLHSVSARDIEDYIDFFDFVFGRSDNKPENRLYYSFCFDRWSKNEKKSINVNEYPVGGIDDILSGNGGGIIETAGEWEMKREDIRDKLLWLMGDKPPGVTNPGPGSLARGGRGEVSFGSFLTRPGPASGMGVMAVSPYDGFGDKLFGYLYYPVDSGGNPLTGKMPVVIYLHEFDYSKGFNSYHNAETLIRSLVDRGYAVFAYDMIGFGNRIEEGTRFYQRYPRWSKMGKMITDASAAVEAMSNLNIIDSTNIYVSGYSLGAKVGLFAAALDDRIAGVVSVAGFTPLRLNAGRGTEGVKAYSHLHGLLPRLGYFAGFEQRIPVDYHEVLAAIAPRPVLVIAPVYDKDAHTEDIMASVKAAREVYGLYGVDPGIELSMPDDYNRFSPGMREVMYRWLENQR